MSDVSAGPTDISPQGSESDDNQEISRAYWSLLVAEIKLYMIVGIPFVGLGIVRGWTSIFEDGEAFLFALPVTLAALWDAGAALKHRYSGDSWDQVRNKSSVWFLITGNLAFLGLSIYYIQAPHQAMTGGLDWVRVLWFAFAISTAFSLSVYVQFADFISALQTRILAASS
jgi:hypothetical protein